MPEATAAVTIRSAPGFALAVATLLVALAGCTSTKGSAPPAPASSSTAASPGSAHGSSGITKWTGNPVTQIAIPLGDGKVSSAPMVGYEDSCTSNFRGGGARSSLPWIDTSNRTWNLKTKLAVEGANTWPDATHSFVVEGSNRVLASNDLPEAAIPGGQRPGITGDFPISSADPAYQYDRNPNQVGAQSFRWAVPAEPTSAAMPSCTPLGPIGVFVNGVVMFNALDDAGRDAGAHEVQDSCDGHPQGREVYHYHDFSACLATAANSAPESSTLVGYALDGYGVYIERDAQGNLPNDGDLDACHGRTSTVDWDGRPTLMYHYDVTLEYPYFVGCFHATPVAQRPRP